jgi:hypothetical protein
MLDSAVRNAFPGLKEKQENIASGPLGENRVSSALLSIQ